MIKRAIKGMVLLFLCLLAWAVVIVLAVVAHHYGYRLGYRAGQRWFHEGE